MKFLLTVLLSFFIAFSAFATNADRIKISSNGKSSKIELRYNSKTKKPVAAVFTIMNAEGKIISTQHSDMICGDNAVCLCEALDLPEGTYTVKMATKKRSYSTQFIIWK